MAAAAVTSSPSSLYFIFVFVFVSVFDVEKGGRGLVLLIEVSLNAKARR